MSKAFTKENDDEEDPDQPDTSIHLNKNYVTPAGMLALQTEVKALVSEERPRVVETVRWAAGNGDRSENGDYIYGKKRLREIDRRVRYLIKRIESAEVVDPSRQKNLKQVFFNAKVTFVQENGQEKTLKIVGIDEADLTHHTISWISPIAKALLKAEVGDSVELKTPAGVETLYVKKIEY